MRMPKVSIVVPIYNVEKYLQNCIESLLCQSLTDIEIILVDDGSPDQSGEIADQYARKDTRIKVVHQRNAGLGPARNSGIEVATGEFIGFVDSDDWVNKNMFERLYEAGVKTNSDIVVGGHCDWSYGKVVRSKVHPLAGKTLTDKNEINEIRKNLYGRRVDDKETDAFPMSVWIAIYKRKLIIDNHLMFQNIISEDIIFNISAYKYANSITFTSDTDYCYRNENQSSIMRSFTENKLKQYENYIVVLMGAANAEDDTECLMRAKRAVINCCRLYVGQVAETGLTIREKKRYVSLFPKSTIVSECWKDYPINRLPFQQRIFQKTIERGNYGIALFLVSVRKLLKERFRIY